jgi:ketosteroid isomerase-like protein
VLWGSPKAESKGGRNRDRRSHRDARDDSTLAETTSDLRVFARTGRIDVEAEVLAAHLAQPDFTSAAFIQTHMAQLNQSALENARHELDRFMVQVQNQVSEPELEITG